MKQPDQHQTTLRQTAQAEGMTLHAGTKVTLRLRPAEAGTGIQFVRADLPSRPVIKNSPDAINRAALNRRTEMIGEGGVTVAMVEHLLAACLGMGLDNVIAEIEGPELPIFDGSAKPYAQMIHEAGLAPLEAPRRYWRLRRPVSLVLDKAELHAIPAPVMTLSFIAELSRAGLPAQLASLQLGDGGFEQSVAPARTFCFYEDIEHLRKMGLIQGGSLDCAIVLRDGAPYQTEYRLPNELACHKLLDLIGDLATLGRPIQALFSARATGHALHHDFIDLLRKELIP